MSETATPIISREALKAYTERELRFWGGLVRTRREDLGMSTDQVAELVGCTSPTIHKIETGVISPRDELRIALAFALSTEVARLFPVPTRAVIQRELAAAS